MTKIRLFPSLALVAFHLAACASMSGGISPSPTPFSSRNSATPAALSPAEATTPSPVPMATSRGAELHATNPMTVSLASGGLQLVEFFRFT